MSAQKSADRIGKLFLLAKGTHSPEEAATAFAHAQALADSFGLSLSELVEEV